MPLKDLDVITIGRSSVDLYGQQIGGRLEDMASFNKSVGGSPSNMAIGTARLGLKSALITRVGDEAMGRFIREQMAREGVNVEGIHTDSQRLTALVVLGVRDDKTFPLIFYRENCADMALDESDIDEAFVARAQAIVVTGTHFSTRNTFAAQKKAIALAKTHGARVCFDIDYRPNLWGLAGHDAGEERYIKSATVSEQLKPILADCDLIVGTEEEIMIAGGTGDPYSSLQAIRALSKATLVLKRGPMGCVVFPDAIPGRIEDGIKGPGFPIEVYNVLGAGDAFMSGFLRGYLKGESLETAATFANACGAIVVSRLNCAPESPSFAELTHFLEKGSPHKALRFDAALNHVHWSTTRRPAAREIVALACDHRMQLEAIADRVGADHARISAFKRLAVAAAADVSQGRDGYGVLLDMKHGRNALFDAAGKNLWIGRPVEEPGSRPLRFEGMDDIGSALVEWPLIHTVKCLAFYHPDDPAEFRMAQDAKLLQLYQACRTLGRECLIEIIAGKHGALERDTVARVLAHLYSLGIKPDWWKLEPQADPAALEAISDVIETNDPWCRGVVLLGLEAPEDQLIASFAAARKARMVRGFAVGRSIFGPCFEPWLTGAIGDDAAREDMAARFGRLAGAWYQG